MTQEKHFLNPAGAEVSQKSQKTSLDFFRSFSASFAKVFAPFAFRVSRFILTPHAIR